MSLPSLAERYWRAALDDSRPRAQIAPDFKRVPVGPRIYRRVPFAAPPGAADGLGRLGEARQASRAVLCASVVAVALSKYHRHDELVVGLWHPAERVAVPLPLVTAREATALDVITATAAEVAGLTQHRAYDAPAMARLVDVALGASRCPFFDVAIAAIDGGDDFDVASYPVDVLVAFDTSDAGVRGEVWYATELFDAAKIERFARHLERAAAEMSARTAAPIADLSILSAAERHHLLHELSGETVAFALGGTIHEMFEAQVRRNPRSVAAVYHDTRLTYAELDARANRFAHTLRALGLERGAFVGILLPRSDDFAMAMLAVFKAGGAYVPLDPTYPRDRIRYMLDDSEAAFVVASGPVVAEYADVITAAACLRVVIAVDADAEARAALGSGTGVRVVGPPEIAAAHDTPLALPLTGRDRAYMIYTSGSTGRPKGAICRHDGALNHLFGELRGLGVEGAFSFLQTAAASSDISVWQFLAPLLSGGATVVVDYDVVVDPARLFDAMRRHRVTVVEVVPVVLRALVDHVADLAPPDRALPDLRAMMSTGEALAAELVDRWLALYPDVPLANTYGPTETSDDVTLVVFREPLAARHAVVPIGAPLPNIRIFVLDRDLAPVPVGVPGEICIAGVGVGEGYWNQPEKTAAAFVPCPFPDVIDTAMYRTGDLGQWLPDGTIEFLGRIDQQVKVRGFRVEPGEIEAVLTQHPDVQDAAVVAVADRSGTNRLVGYFVAHRGRSVRAGDVRHFLGTVLADHMIPAALVPLDAMPLTPLGKLDRKALSTTDYLAVVESDDYVAPRDDVERMIAGVWSATLGVERIGVHDNFFTIGGDSILVVHVVAGLRKAGLAITPRQLFLRPTIAALAEGMPAVQRDDVPAGPSPDTPDAEREWPAWRAALEAAFPNLEDVYTLAPTQMGIYLQSLLSPRRSGTYVEQVAFDLTGALDRDAVARAWQHVIDTTDVLRSAIVRRGVPRPVQVVMTSAALTLDVEDWRRVPDVDRGPRLDALVRADRERGFDLSAPPLMRVTLVRLADDRWHLLWTYHHIILDGSSEPLVLAAVFQAYDALVRGEAPRIERAPPYRTFVAWTQRQPMDAARVFWQRQLAGFVRPRTGEEPTAALTPLDGDQRSHGWRECVLSEAATRALDEDARRNGVTTSTLVHAAWALLLHGRSGARDVLFGSVVSGRQCDCPGIESMRGLIVATHPVRSRTTSDSTVVAWLRALQLHMAESREFEQVPLALIHQWCDAAADGKPLFDTLVVMANYVGSDLAGCSSGTLRMSNVSYVTQPLYPLTLFVTRMDGVVSLRLVYDRRRHTATAAGELLDGYRRLLARIVERPERSLDALGVAR